MSTLEKTLGHLLVAATLAASTPLWAQQQQDTAAYSERPSERPSERSSERYSERYSDIGRAPTAEEIRAWDIDISPDGVGQGKTLFAQRCAACHGAAGEGTTADMLVGGGGTLAAKSAQRTIGSYWPFATTVFDYVRRAMPLDKPGSLTADEVYALSAWLLHANGIVGADAVMNAQTLPAVRMPNRDGFIAADTKPDFIAGRCMQDCK